MRRICTLIALLLSLAIGQEALLACGDKFFLVGRGERFARAYASLTPGNILVYTGGSSEVSKGLRDARLHKFITNAGHRVLLASNRVELERVMKTESVDVILAEHGQAVDLLTQISPKGSGPTLLPVEGKDGGSASPDQFTARLKSSHNGKRLLNLIEDMMNARVKDNGSGR